MEVSVGKGKSVFRVCVRLTLVTDLVLITATAPDKTSPGRSKVKIYPRNDFVSITMIISHLLFFIKVYTKIQPFIQDKNEQVCICQNEDYNSQLQWCHRSRCHAINSAIWLSLWLWNSSKYLLLNIMQRTELDYESNHLISIRNCQFHLIFSCVS